MKKVMIYKVEHEDLNAYLDAWLNKKELPLSFDLMYCEENGIFTALDNSFGECYLEDFDTEKEALLWLSNYEKNEIEVMNIDDSIFNLKVDYEKNKESIDQMKSM